MDDEFNSRYMQKNLFNFDTVGIKSFTILLFDKAYALIRIREGVSVDVRKICGFN